MSEQQHSLQTGHLYFKQDILIFWIHFENTTFFNHYYKIGGKGLIMGEFKLYYLNLFTTNYYLPFRCCVFTTNYYGPQIKIAISNQNVLCSRVLLQQVCTPLYSLAHTGLRDP